MHSHRIMSGPAQGPRWLLGARHLSDPGGGFSVSVTTSRNEEHRQEVEKKWEDCKWEKAEKKAQCKPNSDAWKEKKRKALEEFRAKKTTAVAEPQD